MSEATKVIAMTLDDMRKPHPDLTPAKDISQSLHDDFHTWWQTHHDSQNSLLRLDCYEAYLRGARHLLTFQEEHR